MLLPPIAPLFPYTTLFRSAISDAVQARLEELLGHPETCPHGNPIDAATARRRPAGVPLSTLPSGASATIYRIDRKSTRLNSSHMSSSYAVFCLKKKR